MIPRSTCRGSSILTIGLTSPSPTTSPESPASPQRCERNDGGKPSTSSTGCFLIVLIFLKFLNILKSPRVSMGPGQTRTWTRRKIPGLSYRVRQVYENEWIRVDHHEVLSPAGSPGVYGTVHFKNFATGVVPIDDTGNVILVGQYRFPLGAYSWEIPEGGGRKDRSRSGIRAAGIARRMRPGRPKLDGSSRHGPFQQRFGRARRRVSRLGSFRGGRKAGRHRTTPGCTRALLGCRGSRQARRDSRLHKRRGASSRSPDGVAVGTPTTGCKINWSLAACKKTERCVIARSRLRQASEATKNL